MNYKKLEPKAVIFREDLSFVPNIYALRKVGAGHDGRLYRYGNKVLKILKYDIQSLKEKDLMTFEKAIYFKEELDLKRITVPIDVLLDTDGLYCGYALDFLNDITLKFKKGMPYYKEVSDFSCGDLICSSDELAEDFNELTKHKIVAKDLNRGSYIFTKDFLHLCGMDKYRLECSNTGELNKSTFNFVIAKLLYYEMLKIRNYNKEDLKILSKWVRKCSNSRTFISELKEEIGTDYSCPIGEYSKYKVKQIIK